MATLFAVSIVVLPLDGWAQTRQESLSPHLDRVWCRWRELPRRYQAQKRSALEDYLGLLNRANGATWNQEWDEFSHTMGPVFRPLHADLIEVLKVAEAYEAGLPNPDQKLPRIAETIFGRVPTNALLFVQEDLLETALLIQQQTGRRNDVLLVNSSRFMDRSYLEVLLDRYSRDLRFNSTDLLRDVFKEAVQRKAGGDPAFQDLRLVNGMVRAPSSELVNSLAFVLMQEVHSYVRTRQALVLPSLSVSASSPVCRLKLGPGLFFAWETSRTEEPCTLISDWQSLLDAAAPADSPLHGELANALGRSINAAVCALDAQGQKSLADGLLGIWERRLKDVTIVSSWDASLDKRRGGMTNEAGRPRP